MNGGVAELVGCFDPELVPARRHLVARQRVTNIDGVAVESEGGCPRYASIISKCCVDRDLAEDFVSVGRHGGGEGGAGVVDNDLGRCLGVSGRCRDGVGAILKFGGIELKEQARVRARLTINIERKCEVAGLVGGTAVAVTDVVVTVSANSGSRNRVVRVRVLCAVWSLKAEVCDPSSWLSPHVDARVPVQNSMEFSPVVSSSAGTLIG